MSSNPQPNPYAPPKAEVSDASDTEIVEPASRGSRLGAALVDMVVGIVVMLPMLLSIIPALIRGGGQPNAVGAAMASSFGIGAGITGLLAVAWLVVTYVLVKRNSQTIGKKFVGIKVVRSDGSHASLARIFWLRNIVNALPGAIPFVGNFYGLIDTLFIFNSKRRCIHDMIADTIVVKA